MRLLKILAGLVFLAALGLIGFAYFGDLTPEQTETRLPVELNEN